MTDTRMDTDTYRDRDTAAPTIDTTNDTTPGTRTRTRPAPHGRLTDQQCKGAKPGPTTYELPDGTVPGLALRVTAGGTKAWTLRAYLRGKRVRSDLGEYPAVSLAEARALAQEARKLAERGSDPAEAVLPPLPPPGATVADVCARWLDTKAANRSQPQERRRMALHVLPILGSRAMGSVTKGDVHRLVHDIAFRPDRPLPVEANRVATSLKGMFAWAVEAGIIDASPAATLRKPTKMEPSAERLRSDTEPLLSTEELAQLWNAAASAPSNVLPDLLRVMLLVPLRRDELTDLEWAEVRPRFVGDGWRGPALVIGAERMKGRRPATVPLPAAALAIMDSRRPATERGRYVFSVPGHAGPFAGWRRAGDQLRALLPDRVGDWHPHTLRKSVATALVRDLGADELLVGRVLQHSPRTALGITAVYQRSNRLAEQAALLGRWHVHLTDIAARIAAGSGAGSDSLDGDVVVSLPAREVAA